LDAKLVYWTAAFADLVLVVLCASLGVRRIRRRDARGHRRLMLSAAGLVGLFLLSYLLKVALLGKEDRSAWGPAALVSLYAHESAILVMLVGGAFAATRALRFRRLLDAFPFDADRRARGDALARARRQHRRAGWAALIGSGLALATAALVLLGMYARAARAQEPASPPPPAPEPIPVIPIPEVAERSERLSVGLELRAWTANFAIAVGIRSEVGLAVHDALQRAGVEIPFPQRDLHLRSANRSFGGALAPPAARPAPPTE
jgi:hypothetical protein